LSNLYSQTQLKNVTYNPSDHKRDHLLQYLVPNLKRFHFDFLR